MKTVTDAAIENANELKQMSLHDREFLAFTKGVEFAQRWIPVEEELPEKYELQYSDEVICKFKFKHQDEKCYHEVCQYDWNAGYFIDSDSIKLNDVTHWRPIELI